MSVVHSVPPTPTAVRSNPTPSRITSAPELDEVTEVARQGPPGPPGPPGSGGTGSDARLEILFVTPALSHTVVHNLGKKPDLQWLDQDGNPVSVEWHHIDNNQLVVTGYYLFTGTAVLN